jgi:hypothetical protein
MGKWLELDTTVSAHTIETRPKSKTINGFKCKTKSKLQFRCLNSGVLIDMPQHGVPFYCGDVKFVIYGNAIYIWDEEEE